MKHNSLPLFGVAVLMLLPSVAFAQPTPPASSISVAVTPATVAVGQSFTVTCRLNYGGTTEIDGFAFVINYDPAGLAAVPGSFYLGTNSGPDQQFLLKANQDTNGLVLTNLCDASRPGSVYLTVGDLGRSNPQRGSIASSGFLVSFQMTALAPGSWQLAPAPYIDDAVLYDVFMRPTSTMGFGITTVTVKNPSAVLVQAVDASGSEPGTDSAMFMFTRTGPTNADLVARYTMTGSAGSGDDYEIVPWWLVIPAGASNASLVITPIDDSDIEGDETVIVTLQTSGDYEIATPSTATLTIHDDENMPPAVALTAPAHGTVFPNPTNITLTATATDSNGSVTNVEFFREGTIKLGEDASSPYSIVWSNAPPGTYVLTARATGNLGATADSVPISITVRGPPSVAITSPANGASFGAAGGITVNASATDPDGPLAFVELYRDGTVFAATNGSTISSRLTNMVPGTYALTARASDDRGLLSTSATVTVTVNAVGLSDFFFFRPFLSGYTNYATTNNSAFFANESGEPVHGVSGNRSGWVMWTAPASGTVTMDTFGSSFDTVLAVYTNSPTGPPGMSNLVLVAANNDAGGTAQSQVSFSVLAGQPYAVVVDGNTTGLSGTIHLHISLAYAGPVITTSPQSVLANVGDNVGFSVSASGSSLAYQWRWNGANLSGATASSMTLTNVALTNAGLYDVVVSNSGGAVTSAPAVLVVRGLAEFTALPSTQVVNPGETATFTVSATGSAPLTYQWSFNGVLLPGQITNSFTRYNAQYADGGTYSVTITNAASSSSAGAELIVRPIFTSLTPSNDTLHMTWYGTTGKVYVVEGATNVAAPATNWTVLGSVTNTALEGQFSVSLTNPPAQVIRLRVGP